VREARRGDEAPGGGHDWILRGISVAAETILNRWSR
jgi:hypothetical protein